MEQERPGFGAEKRSDNDNRKVQPSASTAGVKQNQPKQETLGARWGNVQPTKMIVFWIFLAAIVLTMLVGFNWFGWMRGSTAQNQADVSARDAVVQRLATICVAQFNLDPTKEQKLIELQATSSYDRAKYVTTQGWATMPGDEKPDNRVADACAKELMLISP
jgi:hypothetical protein